MAKRPVIWIGAYISSKHISTIQDDLKKSNVYKGVTSFVPMVSVLNKRHKGKEHFEDIPFLFNYGFFSVPKYFLPNSHLLKQMQKDITAIYAWVTDRCAYTDLDYTKNPSYFLHNPMGIGIVTTKEIIRIRKSQNSKSIYSAADVENLYEGKIVVLKGYPFDGLDAEIIKVKKKKKEVEVKLLLQTHMSRVTVSFENIFYTIYKESFMNTEMKELSTDEMEYKLKKK